MPEALDAHDFSIQINQQVLDGRLFQFNKVFCTRQKAIKGTYS